MALRLIWKIARLFKVLRWANLVLVGICLYLFHRILHRFNSILILDGLDFWLFVGVALLVTASGYLINDHFDLETDRINKPSQPDKYEVIRPMTPFQVYLICVSLGAFISAWIACSLDKWLEWVLYPFVVYLLYLYSKQLKGKSIVGNLLVSMMTAVVPLVLLIPEWSWISAASNEGSSQVPVIFFGFSIFSFWVSLFRELIKDLEDIQGDRETGWQTIPVKYGPQFAKSLATSFGFIVITLLIATPLSVSLSGLTTALFALGAIIMIGLLARLVGSHEPIHFRLISQGAKAILIVGLLTVLSL